MSSIFEDVTLTHLGKDYVIPADRIMGLISRIEDVLTLHELAASSSGGKIKLSRLSQAFGVALRYAGATVKDEDIYLSMFSGADSAIQAQNAVLGLLTLMTPPQLSKKAIEDAVRGNPSGKAGAKSSPRRSRSRSKAGA